MKFYLEMVKVRPGIDKIVSELFALAIYNDNITRRELMRLALMRLGKKQSASESYLAADFIVRKVKKLLELNKLNEDSSSIMGSDYGAISIQQSPSEFGEISSQAGVVSRRKEKKHIKKKIKFHRKIK